MLTHLASLTSARPRRSLLAVLLFVLIAGVVGGPVAGALESSGGFAPADAPSVRADRMLVAATGRETDAGLVLLVRRPDAGRARAVAARLAALPGVAAVATPPAPASDGAFVFGTLAAAADDDAVVEAAFDAFRHDGDVVVGGSAVADVQIGETVSSDLGRAELLAFPLLVLLSLLFFRGRAALVPLVVGVTTVLGTFLVLAGVNRAYAVNVFALNLVIGLGLGLAIDYTLLLVTRFREELGRGEATPAAIRATMTTAGRSVAFSAATVACALITLIVFPQGFLKSMGIAGAIVAVVAAVASLAVTPALLALWGTRLARRETGDGAARRWHRLAVAVMKRPGRVAAVTAVAMIAVALPATTVVWTPIDASAIPRGLSARTVADALQRRQDATHQPALTIAVAAPADAGPDVEAYARSVAAVPAVEDVARPVYLGRDTWRLDARTAGTPAGPTARSAVREVRNLHPRFAAAVTGDAADFADQQQAIGSRLPAALVLLVSLTLLVLWLMTGSVLLPLKAVVMNALTVGAALAPLVVVYQHGRLSGLLGYTPNGGVEPSDFLVTAALVFALSTDYGVFLLGRIKEARDGGRSERDAVATGLAGTGRVVTAAAVLLAVAIGAFSTSSISFIQQIGVATATGVLVDAFVVRTLLVPSLMALLGRWNWWAPGGLRRLHVRFGLHERPLADLP